MGFSEETTGWNGGLVRDKSEDAAAIPRRGGEMSLRVRTSVYASII